MNGFTKVVALTLLSISGVAHSADYVAMSGKELYERFCASCHGVSGRGDGRVAASFKTEVPDLTLIARRAQGSYPRDRIVRIIDGRHVIGAHGTRTMPVWGEDFSRQELGNPDAERATRIVIDRLADYVWLLQKANVEQHEATKQ
jgi:mono/diheme cytochrome c family protein